MSVMRLQLATGDLFAEHYRVEQALSAGGMGAVYVVTDLNTERRRALKVMLPELARHAEARERFRKEAQVGASIRSEHVVEVLDAGIDAATDTPYLVMELLEGDDLATLVARRGALSHDEVAAIFEQLVHALAAAHRVGVVHRDLKPENLFLAHTHRSDAERTLKILDFGIAKIVADAQTGSATRSMGSPMWMAPEQTVAGGRIAPATDIWALGLIAFYLLTGRSYWRAAATETRDPVMLLREIALEPLVPASARARELGGEAQLPAGFDTWFEQAVAREPEARFADVDALLDALLPLLRPDAPPRARRVVAESALNLPRAEQADASVETGAFAAHLLADASAETELADGAEAEGPSAPSSRPEAVRESTTAAAAMSTRAVPTGPARVSRALVAAAVVAAAVALVLLSRRQPPVAATTSTASSLESTASVEERAELRAPELGLDALALFAGPHVPRSRDLAAASFWLGAARDFAQAAEQPGAPPRWRAAERFCEGKVALIEGELAGAAAAFRQAIAVEPGWAVPYTGLALALSRLGETQAALDAALAARQRDRDWYVPLSVTASVYARAGKLEEALQEHRRALEKQPDDPALMANLALGCHAVRLDGEADRHARAALERDPSLVAARLLLAERALEKNDGRVALEEATRAAAESPRNAAAHLARGDALMLLGDATEARAAYDRALALADQAGGPEAHSGRIVAVREALARGGMPSPRAPVASPRTPDAPRSPAPRTACSPGDPLCSSL